MIKNLSDVNPMIEGEKKKENQLIPEEEKN